MTPEQIATAWNAWWSSVSTGANDKHMQTAFEAGYLAALKAQQPGEDVVERVARALAASDGLDFDEVCGVDANPDEGYCDSGTCIAAYWEEHDAEEARRLRMHHARAALAAMQEKPND